MLACASLALGLHIAASTPAWAQSALDLLPETVVTASRVETPAAQVGSAVTVLTAEDLQRPQIRFVSDALRATPGVAVSRTSGAGSQTSVRIRGAEANQTLVLIDGIEANDPATGGAFDFAHLLAAGVERVEVVRGEQSALWGSDAIGGVINIVTKRGEEGPPTWAASAEGGSFDASQLGGSVRGGGKSYDYAVNATYYDTNGDNVAPAGPEDDGYRNGTVQLKTGVTPIENLDLNFVGRYTDARSDFDDQDFTQPGTPAVDARNETDIRQRYGRAQARLTLFDGAWEHTVGAAVTDIDNDNDFEFQNSTSTKGEKKKYDYQTNIFVQTPQFANAEHTLILLAEREEEEFTQRGTATFFGDPNQDQEIDNNGYVAEYRLAAWQQLFLNASVRYDDNDSFENEDTYRLTAAYQHPATGIRLRGSKAEGVKNPTFTELFGFFSDQFVGNPDLKPEKSNGWDLGIDIPLFADRVVLDFTHFESELTNEIDGNAPTAAPGVFTAANRSGRSTRRGEEVGVRARASDNLDFTLFYTHLRARAEGENEVRRPENTFSLTANYRFLNDKANANLRVDYTGEQEDLDFSTFPATRTTLKDFTLVRLAASYRVGKHVALHARVENLLDENYQEVLGFETLGRAFFAGIRASF
jgi:vitamin B12 transporter